MRNTLSDVDFLSKISREGILSRGSHQITLNLIVDV